MKSIAIMAVFVALLISGCATVPMATKTESDAAKAFLPPEPGMAGLYIYRNSVVGQALKKDVFIDGKCLGETASGVYFYTTVEGDKTHVIATESEFSANSLEMLFEAGKNYFIRQYIKLGLFVGGAGLELIPEERGKKDVAPLGMAFQGQCSGPQ
ncbi:MAG: DUF2846 domain-containing protein [Deltaproteobacteria bacterium]|jgi:hypothetical protein|nr:DUF2846 domain-containing protein [Deltaproteobacteria bacterium]